VSRTAGVGLLLSGHTRPERKCIASFMFTDFSLRITICFIVIWHIGLATGYWLLVFVLGNFLGVQPLLFFCFAFYSFYFILLYFVCLFVFFYFIIGSKVYLVISFRVFFLWERLQ